MSALISRDVLGVWRHIRRHAVPRSMIAEATAARRTGDWRAACAAAGVLIGADDDELAPYADDLRHLAPDLLRWHLPRSPASGETTIDPRVLIVLARRGGTLLGIATPRVAFSTQRVTLLVAESVDDDVFHEQDDWSRARHLWDAREADQLLARTCGPDSARMLALQDAGRTHEAWAAAGVAVPELPGGDSREWQLKYLRDRFAGLDADPAVLLAAARATGDAAVSINYLFWCLQLHIVDGGPPRAEWVESTSPTPLAITPHRRPVDLHLVRHGLLSPADLHPLIGPLLEPFAAERAGPGSPDGPVRVRCGGAWHAVGWDGGRLGMVHDEDERRREDALQALGGEIHGCFAAQRAWGDRSVRLPRRLERQRRDLLLSMQHGDLAAVTARLDAGVDPRARDAHGRSLLHLLACVDWRDGWAGLLARLLAAGLDVEDRDHTGRTPLHAAVHDHGSPDLVRALLDAGAQPAAEDHLGDTVRDVYARWRKDDLASLAERLG